MKRIRFIINPKSGTGNKDSLARLIEKNIDKSSTDFEICFTKEPGHATVLSKEAMEKNYDIVVAAGGDGSVNETSSPLLHSNTSLGIIPMGSGNGMARHLKIPVNTERAIRLLNEGITDMIDTLSVNDRFCIGTIGVGFDAYIAHMFAAAPKRGYSTYVKLVLTEFRSYKEKRFSIVVDGKPYEKKCFLLTFANSSQFGNNAVIAPFADVKDGLIEISMLSRFPVLAAPSLMFKLMTNSIHRSGYFNALRGSGILVKNNETLHAHIDGEPVQFTSDLLIKMHPLSLKVIVQKK